MCEGDEAPQRLDAKQLEAMAAARRGQLLREGVVLHPVCSRTRRLASRFWGSAWMKQLACCEAGGLNLAPGRTLLRHGCVLDVQVAPGRVEALVSAQELYTVELGLRPPDEERCERLASLCAGQVDSLISLLEGRLAPALLQQLCDPENGLLPEGVDWQISCSCPEWSEPCAHAAAAMYAVGVMLDEQPELLFELRGVAPARLLRPAVVDAACFDQTALSRTFGIDIDVL